MFERRWLSTFVLLVLALGALGGCQTKPVPPTRADLNLVAAPDLNPGPNGTPLPVAVRIYRLKNRSAFDNAGFFSLYSKGATLLAGDLTAPPDELDLIPGERRAYRHTLRDDTRFIGIVAAYRDIDNAVWRAVLPVSAHHTAHARVMFNKLSVSVVAGK